MGAIFEVTRRELFVDLEASELLGASAILDINKTLLILRCATPWRRRVFHPVPSSQWHCPADFRQGGGLPRGIALSLTDP